MLRWMRPGAVAAKMLQWKRLGVGWGVRQNVAMEDSGGEGGAAAAINLTVSRE